MAELRKKQSKFVICLAGLILDATKKGYELTIGDAYRDPRVHGEMGVKLGYSHPSSTHKQRLAVDFNVFKGGVLLEGSEADKAHKELHEFWVSVGGSPMIIGDSNHYSFEEGGIR